MTEIEQLQAEVDVLRGEIAALTSATMMMVDNLAALLEAVTSGGLSRSSLSSLMIMVARNRRVHADISSVEFDLIEQAAERLLRPSTASVIVLGNQPAQALN